MWVLLLLLVVSMRAGGRAGLPDPAAAAAAVCVVVVLLLLLFSPLLPPAERQRISAPAQPLLVKILFLMFIPLHLHIAALLRVQHLLILQHHVLATPDE